MEYLLRLKTLLTDVPEHIWVLLGVGFSLFALFVSEFLSTAVINLTIKLFRF